jgi:hypothetical protein
VAADRSATAAGARASLVGFQTVVRVLDFELEGGLALAAEVDLAFVDFLAVRFFFVSDIKAENFHVIPLPNLSA